MFANVGINPKTTFNHAADFVIYSTIMTHQNARKVFVNVNNCEIVFLIKK